MCLLHRPPINGLFLWIVLVVQALEHKVVTGQIHDTSSAVRQSTQDIALFQVIQIVSLFQVEQSLLALTSLAFSRVTL
jgi:hypothetical protein